MRVISFARQLTTAAFVTVAAATTVSAEDVPDTKPTVSDVIKIPSEFSQEQVALAAPFLDGINEEVKQHRVAQLAEETDSRFANGPNIQRFQEILGLEKQGGDLGPETSGAILKLWAANDSVGLHLGNETFDVAIAQAPETYIDILQTRQEKLVDHAQSLEKTLGGQQAVIDILAHAYGDSIDKFTNGVKTCIGQSILSDDQQKRLTDDVLEKTNAFIAQDQGHGKDHLKRDVRDLALEACDHGVNALPDDKAEDVKAFAAELADTIADQAAEVKTLIKSGAMTPEAITAMEDAGVITRTQGAIAAGPVQP